MNYELAKQLKDAGFPQEGKGMHFLNYDIEVYQPTFSELIEACGDNFSSLIHGAVNWSAKAVVNGSDDGVWCDGSTHEEAVAKLWLELNKK